MLGVGCWVGWKKYNFFNNRQPTTNYQQPTTNYQLPTTNYQLSTIYYQLSTTNFKLPLSDLIFPFNRNFIRIGEELKNSFSFLFSNRDYYFTI
ncbi:MAG: hypothetical protein CMC13_08770 [Flavobacteriaceae bacterium]|nr:hypothetical protein [Flavobacteriaceae bacterium]